LNEVREAIKKERPKINPDLKFGSSGLINHNGTKLYKCSILKGKNIIWVQLEKNEINIVSNYYIDKGANYKFIQIAELSNLNKNKTIGFKESKEYLKKLFLEQVEITNEIFEKYDTDVIRKQ